MAVTPPPFLCKCSNNTLGHGRKQHGPTAAALVRSTRRHEEAWKAKFPPRALQQLQTIDAGQDEHFPRIRNLTALPWCSVG